MIIIPHNTCIIFLIIFMKKIRTVFSTMIALSLGIVIGASSESVKALINFPDVTTNAYYYNAASNMAEIGFITGYEDGNFGPNDPVTRGQIAVIMDRMWSELADQGAVSPVRSTSSRSSISSRSSVRSSESSSSSLSRANSSSSTSLATSGDYFKFFVAELTYPESTPRVSITVSRIGANSTTASVEYETIAGSATAGEDYTATSGKLQFNQGETSKTITVNLKDDEVYEESEYFYIRLKNPSTGLQIGAPHEVKVTITDNDTDDGTGNSGPVTAAGKLDFSARSYAVSENKGSITVTIVRTGGSTGEVSVDYSTKGATALSSDFDSTNGTLTFAAGETTKTFTVNVKDNGDRDGNKVVDLYLKNPTGGAVIGVSTVPLTITDDEITTSGTGSFKFDKGSVTVSERDGIVELDIVRMNGYEHDVTLNVDTRDGNTSVNSDYEPLNTTITFKAGESKKRISVKILRDDLIEPDEVFFVKLSNPTNNATIGTPNEVAVTIDG